eukprot:GHVL01035460.1.p1 GENE.GHVL01035460.1~~GHVL01035460.1.p1  ORF type:complete len:114 (+),score=22.50 GHVL01035460.1:54-344(+)
MSSILENIVGLQITLVTNDGRIFVGILRGFDQQVNVVLADCNERVYHEDSGVETVSLGLYVVRGDNIAVIGEIDEEVDARVNLNAIRAAPLKPVCH